jgi:hypothetical protein
VVVPPVPEKSPFGRFEDAFVQQRRLGLEKCINKIASHPVLMKDLDLKMFLESDSFALDVCLARVAIVGYCLMLFALDQAKEGRDCERARRPHGVYRSNHLGAAFP